MPRDHPPADRRREIFKALVQAQDTGLSVESSRRDVAEQFGITEAQVRRIERQGLDDGWPPLSG